MTWRHQKAREHDKELRNQAREMNEVDEDLNIKFKVTGPPWERNISKINVRNHSQCRQIQPRGESQAREHEES